MEERQKEKKGGKLGWGSIGIGPIRPVWSRVASHEQLHGTEKGKTTDRVVRDKTLQNCTEVDLS